MYMGVFKRRKSLNLLYCDFLSFIQNISVFVIINNNSNVGTFLPSHCSTGASNFLFSLAFSYINNIIHNKNKKIHYEKKEWKIQSE